MHLKHLEIHGFKSFAQKTVMEFGKGIIAIVGPNGSGKSNVADCLRWVLGEQSAKMMRGKKSDDVIFAGSDKKTRFGFAEVTATFDNHDRRIPVDAAEVSIGRRIDRHGNSDYLINGNVVRLLDIVDLVLKSNIGTSRYTVIGQGTIDQMVLSGPTEVKNLIDEASGVKTYYIRRDKSMRRLEQTAQNLMRAEDLIREIEPRLKSLRRQAKKMEARTELEQELKHLQKDYFGKTFWVLKDQIDIYENQIGVLTKKSSELESEKQGLIKKAEEAEKSNGGQMGKFKEIQNHLEKLQKQKNKIIEELSLVRGKMQSQKSGFAGDPKTLQIEIHALAGKIEETKKNIENTKNEQADFKKKSEAQNEFLSNIKNKLELLYQKVQGSAGQMDWLMFEREFSDLDRVVSEFYENLEQKKSWDEIEKIVLRLKQQFGSFREVVKNSVLNPHQINLVQQEIALFQKQKDEVDLILQDLHLSLSKTEIYLNFLHKDQENLEQQKMHLDLELKKIQSVSVDEFLRDLLKEDQKLNAQVEVLSKEISAVEDLFKKQQGEQSFLQKELHNIELDLRDKQDELSKIKDQISALSVEKAKSDTQMEVLRDEVVKILGLEIFEGFLKARVEKTVPDADQKIFRLKNQLEMIGGMDDLTLKEYKETENRYVTLSTQVEDLKKSTNDLKSIIDELDEHIKTKFNNAFKGINEKFEYYFRILFNGGRAYLSILKADENDDSELEGIEQEKSEVDLSEVEVLRPEEKMVRKYEKGASNIIGIDIKATPPGKKLSSIQALSGGERSLTSIALLCSLLTCFPSPFVVLDEVDAALDDANTIRFGQILGTLANQTQFLTITHNRETMSRANMLYGVTMGDDGVSKLLSVKLDQAKAFAK